ncbi:MAG: hypothetical protein HY791_09745 [Deltaproteobacteria bacterium]|nr:hypothetical protein [Deltaproteobacteria bacterium]
MAEVFSLLQRRLEDLYRIHGAPEVGPFCMDDEHLELLGPEASGRREALMVHQEEGSETADVGLFVATNVRQAAERFLAEAESLFRCEASPRRTRGEGSSRRTRARGSIDAFCVALEGVSHFLYFTFSSQRRPVSLIELELQAEVDKFLVLRLHFDVPDLLETLFDRISFDESLLPEVLDRYKVANDRARRYARWLDRTIRRGGTHDALEDARHLYRKPFQEKLEHIARAA